ncbi:MAG: hypothetical protein WC464_05610 [Bdellovibrionales bacterium]
MDGILQNPVLPSKVYEIAPQIRIGSWDFEGATIASEVVMQGSFKTVLDENGIYRDIYDIELETSGHGLKDIFTKFKTDNNLKPSIESMLERRLQVYLEMVEDYQLTPFSFVAPLARLLNGYGAEQFFLSNGAHAAIAKIAGAEVNGEPGVYPRYIDRIFASDSRERLEYAKTHGLKEGDKAAFLAEYSIEKGVPPYQILLVEDNHRHIQNTQKAMRDSWKDLLSRKPAVGRKTGLSEETIGEVQEIYVQNEFNKRHGFTPNTGVVFQGLAPRKLCQVLGIK